MAQRVLIAGGGIGGLAAALSLAQARAEVDLFERAGAFAEVGAGIQLGPNVTRLLHGWGLALPLRAVAAFPSCLRVRGAATGQELAALRLGEAMQQRYGAPYATIHRADLHGLLLHAVREQGHAKLHPGQAVSAVDQTALGVRLQSADARWHAGELLVGADGLWSVVRQQLLGDGLPRFTGQLAFRALCPQRNLPAALRSQEITVWLAPGVHVVQYPVRGGEFLNMVAVLQSVGSGAPGADAQALQDWDHATDAAPLRAALAGSARALQDCVRAMDNWRLWALCDRPALRGPQEQFRGRIVLLGDAAHPMRPYLAQGAGMAIEDAAELGRLFQQSPALPMAELAARYAQARWQRNRRVQQRSRRNGSIFHASGPVRMARDAALRLLGERLIDLPWLYRGG